MNILFIGDISGRPGREVVGAVLPGIKQKHKVDLVVANTENSAGGRGVTLEIMNELQSYGVDFFTTGEHVWDQKVFRNDLYDENLPIVRPLNYEGNDQIPGSGYKIIDLGKNKIIVVSLVGQTFMREPARSPFWVFDELWEELKESGEVEEPFNSDSNSNPIIIVDFHAEATSEKVTLGWYLRDRVSAMFGTHTHVPTADEKIIGTMAYVTDAGMCGPKEASLWVDFNNTIHNFKFPFKEKFEMKMDGPRIFNSLLVNFEGNIATNIQRIDKTV